LDTGCDNGSSNNATIKHEVKEEIILEENHVRSENNEEHRFVVFFYSFALSGRYEWYFRQLP
jgi:hypothetical protein